MTAFSFTVPGAPVPKARPRVYGGRTITEPRTVAYEALVRAHALKARQHAKRAGAGITWPLDADARYTVALTFWMPTRRRADVDNLAKSVLDACNAVLWDDDSAVVKLVVRRGYDAAEPRCEVLVQATTLEAWTAALERGGA